MKLQDIDFRLYIVSEKDYVRDEDKYKILGANFVCFLSYLQKKNDYNAKLLV